MHIYKIVNTNGLLYSHNQCQNPYDIDLEIKYSDSTNDHSQPNFQNLSGGADTGALDIGGDGIGGN